MLNRAIGLQNGSGIAQQREEGENRPQISSLDSLRRGSQYSREKAQITTLNKGSAASCYMQEWAGWKARHTVDLGAICSLSVG